MAKRRTSKATDKDGAADQRWYQSHVRSMLDKSLRAFVDFRNAHPTVEPERVALFAGQMLEWHRRTLAAAACGDAWEAAYCAMRVARYADEFIAWDAATANCERQKRIRAKGRAARAKAIFASLNEESPRKGRMFLYRETARKLSEEMSRATGKETVVKVSTVRAYLVGYSKRR